MKIKNNILQTILTLIFGLSISVPLILEGHEEKTSLESKYVCPKPLVETESTTVTVDGYKFNLSIENNQTLKTGQTAMLVVKVTKPDGQPSDNLEPIMAAFAHGVGFPRDLSSVMHVHPMGKEPQNDSDRGGPELKFHIVPEKPGWLKFYAQVQIDGHSKFAGFGLRVLP